MEDDNPLTLAYENIAIMNDVYAIGVRTHNPLRIFFKYLYSRYYLKPTQAYEQFKSITYDILLVKFIIRGILGRQRKKNNPPKEIWYNK